jgi:hypothetical protein
MFEGFLTSAASSLFDNELKTREAKRQDRFSQYMSNTAYQRSMKDMRKAGLNPILVGKVGGASTPTAGKADVGNKTLENMATAKQIQLLSNQAKKAAAEADKTEEELLHLQMDTDTYKNWGLSPSAFKHKPSNVFGSAILNQSKKIAEMEGPSAKNTEQKQKQYQNLEDQIKELRAYKRMLTPKMKEAINNQPSWMESRKLMLAYLRQLSGKKGRE